MAKAKLKVKPNISGKWNDDFIWKAYELAQQGNLTDAMIAKSLKLDPALFCRMKKDNRGLRNALKAARKGKRKSSTADQLGMLQEYVHGRLPEELKPVWNEIMGASNDETFLPAKRLTALLGDYTNIKETKQTLWLYAWFESNFNQSEACRQVNVYRRTVELWKKDADFFNLFNEMNRIKGDFFESALVKGVRDGNPFLIGFANKSFNRDRGYGESIDVNVTGTIEHTHVVKIED